MEKLFDDGLDGLYTKAGARNFLLMDVPPKDRSPGGESGSKIMPVIYYLNWSILALELSENLSERYDTWNQSLRFRSEAFISDTSQATLFLFSTHEVVSEILDDPEEFGFSEDDVTQEEGAIWQDELHFTSEVHAILAEHIEKALRSTNIIE